MDKAAKVITENNYQILEEWEALVTDQIKASRHTNKIILLDHLPNMLNDIADIFNRFSDVDEVSSNEKFQEIISNSSDHGRHRAASEDYSIDHIIHEYILLHRILTKYLRQYEAYDIDKSDLLKYIIETAILQSSKSFNESLQEMQETLMGTLAHDLRNPMSTAYTLLQIMEKEQDRDMLESFRQMALGSLKKTIQLTEGLLDAVTVKAGEGMMLEFKENDIISEIKTVYEEARAVYNHDIRLDCPDKEIKGILDGTAIRRLLENLLTNAIKYGDISRPVTIRLSDEGEMIRLSVHNYGTPIPDDQKESIFGFMNRSDSKQSQIHPSWGMGLTLVKIVAESHGGKVEVTSNEEEGTLFTFYLKKQNEPGKRRTHIIRRKVSPQKEE